MSDWRWLAQTPEHPHFIARVLAKAALLFVVVNLAFALLNPLDVIGAVSLYNGPVPGRVRLPYGEDPRAYNLSLNNLTAMFASHQIARPKSANEYRVVFIGDSSLWGILLHPDETVTEHINRADLTLTDGRQITAYNLGHPILALSKDLLLLDHALRYEPDMVVWLTTLRSFPRERQFDAPLVRHNAGHIRRLFAAYGPAYNLSDDRLIEPTLLERTIVGQRRALADWLRLQLFGIMWGITGIDQYYPDSFDLRTSDFDDDISWEGYTEPRPIPENMLAFDILDAGQQMLGSIPLLLVNEPIFISDGQNSDLRYNLWYPRWAYDNYREQYRAAASTHNWRYLDLWNSIDSSEFTDSPVHLTPAGSRQLAERLSTEIIMIANEDT